MKLAEKATMVKQLTKEIVEEAKTLENQQIAGLFRSFGEEFISSVNIMAKWLENV